jgi:arsenite-transporting ATPase
MDATTEFDRIKQHYVEEIAAFFEDLSGRAGVDLGFDRAVFEHVMDLAPPGLDEVMALTRVVDLLEAGTYDLFILDTAPSGHFIRLLELPQLVQDWLKVLFDLFLQHKNVFRLRGIMEFLVSLSKGLKAFRSLLTDPRKGQLVAVSILTEVSLEKTRDLLAACQRAQLHVRALMLNLVTPEGRCPLCHVLAEAESGVRPRFATVFHDIPRTVVYRCSEPLGRERLAELGRALYSHRS